MPAMDPRPHRSCLIHQNARRLKRRYGDSLYGARKKKLEGNEARSTTVRRATPVSHSRVVSAYRTMSAPKNDAFDTSSAAPGTPIGVTRSIARIASGYPGK